MSEPLSALAGAQTGEMTISVADAGRVGQVTLKVDLAAPDVATSLEASTGMTVPEPLSVMSNDTGGRLVWMAPDEVLIVMPDDARDPEDLVKYLETTSAGAHRLAANVTDARAMLRLSGRLVPEVLAKGAPVDLSETAFPVGGARRTHLAGIAVAFWRVSDHHWEIVCLRSYAHHLWAWLETAATPGSEVGLG